MMTSMILLLQTYVRYVIVTINQYSPDITNCYIVVTLMLVRGLNYGRSVQAKDKRTS